MDEFIILIIPIARIRPNPKQPRKLFNQETIDRLAASLTAVGQKTEIKVRPLTPEEKLADPDHDYELIGGEMRYRAALKAGLDTLQAKVLNVTPVEADLEAQLDNERTDLTWLEKDLAIARRVDTFNLSQRQVAQERAISQSQVARAVRVAEALTPAAIALIDQTLVSAPPDDDESESNRLTPKTNYEVSRFVVLALAALKDPQNVEKALKVVIERQMTETQARKLVEGIKAGQNPEDFHPQTTPKVKKSSVAPPQVAALPAPSSPAFLDTQRKPPTLTEIDTNQTHSKRTSIGGAALLKSVLGGWFKKGMVKELEMVNRGLVRKAVAWIFGLILMGGSYLGITHFTHKNIQPQISEQPNTTTPMKQTPKLRVKTQEPPKAPAPKAESTDTTDQGQLVAWLATDGPFISQFADRFFSLNFSGYQKNLDFLKQQLSQGYYTEFMADYFPPEKINEIRKKMLVLSFQPAQPPKLVKLEGVMDEFQVAGTLRTVSQAGRSPQTLSNQPVALDIQLRHIAGAKGTVYRVTAIDPQKTEVVGASSVSNNPSSVDSSAQEKSASKKDDGLAKFVGDAAAEAAKKAVGINF